MYPTTNVLHRVFKLQLIVNDDEGEEIIISGGTMPIFTQHGYETGLFHRENMGLALAWDIQRCIDIINQNPIGLELPSR